MAKRQARRSPVSTAQLRIDPHANQNSIHIIPGIEPWPMLSGAALDTASRGPWRARPIAPGCARGILVEAPTESNRCGVQRGAWSWIRGLQIGDGFPFFGRCACCDGGGSSAARSAPPPQTDPPARPAANFLMRRCMLIAGRASRRLSAKALDLFQQAAGKGNLRAKALESGIYLNGKHPYASESREGISVASGVGGDRLGAGDVRCRNSL